MACGIHLSLQRPGIAAIHYVCWTALPVAVDHRAWSCPFGSLQRTAKSHGSSSNLLTCVFVCAHTFHTHIHTHLDNTVLRSPVKQAPRRSAAFINVTPNNVSFSTSHFFPNTTLINNFHNLLFLKSKHLDKTK